MAVTTLQLANYRRVATSFTQYVTFGATDGFSVVGGGSEDTALPASWFAPGTSASLRTLRYLLVGSPSIDEPHNTGLVSLRFGQDDTTVGPQLTNTFATSARVTIHNDGAGDLVLHGIGVGDYPDVFEPYNWVPSDATAEYTPSGGTRTTGAAAVQAWQAAATDTPSTIAFDDAPPVYVSPEPLRIAIRLGTPDVFNAAPPLPASVDHTLVLSEANAGGVDRTNNFVRWTVASSSSGFPADDNDGTITLPASWFDKQYPASERTLNRVILRTTGVVQLHFGSSSASNIGPQLKAEFRDNVDVIVSEAYAGILTLHGIGVGDVPDTTEPYRWTPNAASATHTQTDGSARRTGATAVAQFRSRYWFGGVDKTTIQFQFQRTLPPVYATPEPLRIAIRLGAPTLSAGVAGVTITPEPLPIAIRLGSPTLNAPLVPERLRIALRLGSPTLSHAAAALTPEPLRIALRLGSPSLNAPLTPERLRVALRLGSPTLSHRAAPLTPEPLRIAIRLGSPTLTSTAPPVGAVVPEPLRIAIRLGSPTLNAPLVPEALPIALRLGAPTLNAPLVPESLRIALRLGSPTLSAPVLGVTIMPEPLPIAIRLGSPTLNAPLVPEALRIALRLGAPSLNAPLVPEPLRIAIGLGSPSFKPVAAAGVWPIALAPISPRYMLSAPPEVERVVYDDGAIRQARINSGGGLIRKFVATVAASDLAEVERWLTGHAHTWFRFTDPHDGVERQVRIVGGVAGIEMRPTTTAVGPVRWALSGTMEGQE